MPDCLPSAREQARAGARHRGARCPLQCLALNTKDGINAHHLQAPLLLRLGKHAEVEALLGTGPRHCRCDAAEQAAARLAAWGQADAEENEAKEAEAEAAFEAAFAAN